MPAAVVPLCCPPYKVDGALSIVRVWGGTLDDEETRLEQASIPQHSKALRAGAGKPPCNLKHLHTL